MLFIIILLLTTTSIAGTAAFFSVYGLAHIFSGSFWAVVFMGGALEAGKLVSVSFLYRYWKTCGWALKTYLMSAVLLLMVITSTGIFGYLSNSYNTDSLDFKSVETQITSLETEKQELSKRKEEIDKQISQLPPDYVAARQRLMRTFKPELQHINVRIPELTSELQKLKQQKLQVQSHTGPIVYIASSAGLSVDDATKWIIIMLIVVFDPLAIALTIATNKVVLEKKTTTPTIETPTTPPLVEQPPLVSEPPEPVTPQVIEDIPIPKEVPQPPPVIFDNTANDQALKDLDKKIQEIQDVLVEFSKKEKLTPEEDRQQQLLEEVLRRRSIMDRIKTGNKSFI